jgi:hypothetical protein
MAAPTKHRNARMNRNDAKPEGEQLVRKRESTSCKARALVLISQRMLTRVRAVNK